MIYGDVGEINIIIENLKTKFMIIRFVIYIFSLIIIIISWYYLSIFFSIYQNTQIHLLKDFGSCLLMNLVISIIKSFLYCIYKYILERTHRFECLCGCCKKFYKVFYEIFNKKFVIFIIEVIIEILVIYISKQFKSFQTIHNLFYYF